MGDRKAAHHRGAHDKLAKLCCDAAYANPEYRCPTCGLTLDEGIARWGETSAKWDGGHIREGEQATSVSDYHAQHARCNRSLGAIVGNANRHGNALGL